MKFRDFTCLCYCYDSYGEKNKKNQCLCVLEVRCKRYWLEEQPRGRQRKL